MKIVFLSFYQGCISRGMETVVHELAKRLVKRHQVMVVQTGPKYSTQKPYQVKRIRMNLTWPKAESRGWQRKLFIDYDNRMILVFTLKSLRVLNSLKPDILVPTNGGWMSFLMKLFCLFNRKKLILLGQAGIGWDDRWNLLTKPNLFIALNKRNLDWSKKHSRPNQKFSIIPNGVDLKKFCPEGKKASINLEKPIILCVAGPEGYKRVKETIKAVAQLDKGSLLLVSSSSIYDHYGKKILGKRFLRKKFLHHEMPEVYRTGDIFTLVSESTEAFGVAYLEAMASGLPVVATDDQSRYKIIGKAGLFVKNPENNSEYAQILSKALIIDWEDKSRRQVEKFSWDNIARKYQEEMRKLIRS